MAARSLPGLSGRQGKPAAKLHCELDDWWFDPRYTGGVCPICGWKPEDAAYPAPLWLRIYRRLDWELIGLVAMVAVLVFVGWEVARSAGLTWADIGKALTGR